MKSKKGQTDIIVTVLLILIALAAVAAIAYFIVNAVRGSSAQAADKAECLKVTLNIESAVASTDNVTISRGADTVSLKTINLYVNGKFNTTTTINPVESATVVMPANLAAGDKVRANPVLTSNSFVCEAGIEKIVTA